MKEVAINVSSNNDRGTEQCGFVLAKIVQLNTPHIERRLQAHN